MRRTEEHLAAPEQAPTATFEGLYLAEYAPMVRLAFVMLDEAATAEEVVQDAFARVYERWAALDQPGAYLRTCVVNGCRDGLRRRRLTMLRRPAPPAEMQPGPDHLLDALASLPPRRRAAVVLRYYADLPEAEIAELLGIRPGTVKSMLHRSLRQLREVIER